MNEYIKLEVAVDILSNKIASLIHDGYTIENQEIQNLLIEREEMYKCNMEIINKIINEYGPELKEKYNQQTNIKKRKK